MLEQRPPHTPPSRQRHALSTALVALVAAKAHEDKARFGKLIRECQIKGD